jgi:hypothetical protein
VEIHKPENITSQILLQDIMMILKQQQFHQIGHWKVQLDNLVLNGH